MILPRPTAYRKKTRIAIIHGEGANSVILSDTTYTLAELQTALETAIQSDPVGVFGFWSLPSGKDGVLELICVRIANIKFWAISETSELVLADKLPIQVMKL